MYKCSGLTGIDLSGLSNLQSIGNNFMNSCSRLETIICTEIQHKLILITNLNIKTKFKIVHP
jgi:hypothetical protein